MRCVTRTLFAASTTPDPIGYPALAIWWSFMRLRLRRKYPRARSISARPLSLRSRCRSAVRVSLQSILWPPLWGRFLPRTKSSEHRVPLARWGTKTLPREKTCHPRDIFAKTLGLKGSLKISQNLSHDFRDLKKNLLCHVRTTPEMVVEIRTGC